MSQGQILIIIKEFLLTLRKKIAGNRFTRQLIQFIRRPARSNLLSQIKDLEARLNASNAQDAQNRAVSQSIYLSSYPPGHYYSPIPDFDELQKEKDRIFSVHGPQLDGISLDVKEMLTLLTGMKKFRNDFDFPEHSNPSARFYLDNGVYSKGDAIVYYSMIRILKPKRIIEIGSGMSTCLAFEVNQKFFDNKIQLTGIDPYPERMLAMLQPGDDTNIEVIREKAQNIDLNVFKRLEANDILFVDSSHVSKCGSDVNYIFFEILPALKPGVVIHFHDTFYPFEYPQDWLLKIGVAWNETYLLRAFLQYNSQFKIIVFNDYLAKFHRKQLEENIPFFLQGVGSSLWIRKLD